MASRHTPPAPPLSSKTLALGVWSVFGALVTRPLWVFSFLVPSVLLTSVAAWSISIGWLAVVVGAPGMTLFLLALTATGFSIHHVVRGDLRTALTHNDCLLRSHRPACTFCRMGIPAVASAVIRESGSGDAVLVDLRAFPKSHGAGRALLFVITGELDHDRVSAHLTREDELVSYYKTWGFQITTDRARSPLTGHELARMVRLPHPV